MPNDPGDEAEPKPAIDPDSLSSDVDIIEVDGRQFILVGTAHISRESVDLVRESIQQHLPDTVCIELDKQRHDALTSERRFESLDLRQVIRKQQLATLLINLLLVSYQRRLGVKLGVMPGSELLEAARVANELDIPVELCDRDIRITMRRAWKSLSLFKKLMLMSSLLAGIFDNTEIGEEELREMRKKDVLSELMRELGEVMPSLKRVLIDERDQYLASKIVAAPGAKVLAVVGAGHVAGMKQALAAGQAIDLSELETVPPVSAVWKWIGMGIPVIILSSLAYIGYNKGVAAAGENALYWVLANGIPSALGCLLALGHPITIVTGFVAAPLTSLTPVIGAGYVTAFVQTYLRPPMVAEFQSVGDDLLILKRWWQSRLLRIFLVFILSSFGSFIGTWAGGYEILSNLF